MTGTVIRECDVSTLLTVILGQKRHTQRAGEAAR